jgi:hypothetical protein
MAFANVLGFFMEDAALHRSIQVHPQRSIPIHEAGYSMCPACGMEILLERDHPEFCHCPECGGKLVK